MNMINVLEVIRQGQIGGGESHLLDLISYLDRSRIEPICLSFTDGEMISRLKQMGVTCHIIETCKPFDVNVQRQIKQLLIDYHIDIVHAHGSRAASNVVWPAHSLHIHLIYTVHGWSFHDDQPWPVRKLRALSEKCICHYCDKVICVSQSNADTGHNTFGLKDAHVIENGINLERFNPSRSLDNLRPTMGLLADDYVIGFVARCTKQKNPIVFLSALEMAHERNAHIKGVFVGEGDMDNEVNTYISEHNMQEYLFRSKFRTDVPELLQAIDVYCLPSLWEGLSIALLEAMAMKKAIIATPTDGTRELIVNDNNGIIVPFNDTQALSDAFMMLAQQPENGEKLGEAARNYVEQRFNAQRVADKVTEIYEEVYQEIQHPQH